MPRLFLLLATAVVAVSQIACERLMLPLPTRRDYVDVSLKQQRRALPAPGQAGDQVLAILEPGKEDELRRVLLKR